MARNPFAKPEKKPSDATPMPHMGMMDHPVTPARTAKMKAAMAIKRKQKKGGPGGPPPMPMGG